MWRMVRGSPVNLQTLETDPDNPSSPIDLILVNLAIGIVFIKRTMYTIVPDHLAFALVILYVVEPFWTASGLI